MAARKGPRRAPKSRARTPRQRAAKTRAALVGNVQQIWLAGMGAIARAQKDGPAAFQEAVAEGLELLNRSRSGAKKVVRDAFASAQDSVQTRMRSARGQAQETWDNLEVLFQSRVQKALQQIGVPSAEEVRILTKRVAELNDSVKRLAAERRRPARGRRAAGPRASKRASKHAAMGA